MRHLAGITALTLAAASPAQAQMADRELLQLAAGETREAFGTTFTASESATAIVVLSSELVTAAVISGALETGGQRAIAGQALVRPIDGQRTRRYGFDAARLAASLPLAWAGVAEAPLAALAERQRRRAFWGLIEPVGVNAAAPVAPEAEAFRSAYLDHPAILALRQQAGGDRQALAGLTLQAFAAAMASRDTATLAALLDPQPFTAAHPDPAIWLPARTAVAARLAADSALARALAAGTNAGEASSDAAAFDAGGAFRIGLVRRDRAYFIAAVEPIQ